MPMKEFFKVTELVRVLEFADDFETVGTEEVSIFDALGRILAEDAVAAEDLPDFNRSTMDGFAVKASSSFGASESNPAYVEVKGAIRMGQRPDFSIGPGPGGAHRHRGDASGRRRRGVVMVEHTDVLDDTTIEVFKSVAPGQNMIMAGEDFAKGGDILKRGRRIRPQEAGLVAAFGKSMVKVFKKPSVGIISTGDEIVGIDDTPGLGQIRDINTYTLFGQILEAGGVAKPYGIVKDDYESLYNTCKKALEETDMVLISGGSSVGVRDFTVEVLENMPDSEILVHGITISPGKPTILARCAGKPFWGLPGHVVSAMVVFSVVARPFLEKIGGLDKNAHPKFCFRAKLTRNISSAQGRVEFVRVRLENKDGELLAEPVLGKSGLIRTMVGADGLVEVGMNVEGLEKGDQVDVIPF